MATFTSFSAAVFKWVSGSSYTAVSLKLLVSHIAVSLGETFSGPNGFSNTPSSSNLSCCNSRALNSSNPSNASARCWYDEVSNRRCRESNDDRLETTVAGFCSEQSLPFRGARRPEGVMWGLASVLPRTWTVHLSFVIERSPLDGEALEH